MKIGNREFDLKNHCYVMGILNVTPDSFSDGGRWNQLDAAKKHTEDMIHIRYFYCCPCNWQISMIPWICR